jgi:HSP20 family molecular chaperone IbpA
MNNDVFKNTLNKPLVVGLVTLLLGILIGVATDKVASRSPVLASGDHTTNVTAVSPNFAATNLLMPDPFFADPFDNWDPFREMRNMQAEMDEMFQRSITRFHMNPQMDLFKDDAGYSSSLDVRELKDRYEVRAFLPDAKDSDTKVNLQGNRLDVEVTHKQTEQQQNTNSLASTTEWGRYTQTVELAGKLNSEKMKVERKEHELLITIPKG